MLKGVIISDTVEPIENVNNKEAKEENLLNKKRENNIQEEEFNRNKKRFHKEKEQVIGVPYAEADGIDMDEFVNKAFYNFLHFDQEGFINSFNKLETYKNSKNNIVKEEATQEVLILEDKFVQDGCSEEIDENEEFDKYKTQDEYYNKDLNRCVNEHKEVSEVLTNKIKDDLIQMKNFDDFEKSLNNFTVKKDETSELELVIPKVDKKQEVKENKKQERKRLTVLSSCQRCFGAKLSEYSIISHSDSVYLAYPFFSGSITDFHVVVSTKEHISSLAATEENVYEEIRNFMKSIVSFNLEREYSTIFIEHSQHINKMNHFEIECIPIKHKMLDEARMYFKKAFMDQDYEWSTNQKLVDTTPYKGNLTKILSEKFSYVHVDFNALGGFLHPIEDDSRFSQLFLKEIFCPLIKKQIHEIKYPKKLSVKELIDTVEDYKKRYDYFDWTKYQ